MWQVEDVLLTAACAQDVSGTRIGQLSLIIYDNGRDYLMQGLMTNDMHHNCTVMIIINYLLTPTHDKMYVL